MTHRAVELDPPSQATIAEVGVHAAGRSVWLHLEADSAQEATGLRLQPDSLRWTTGAGVRRAVHPGQIRRIEIRNRPRGLFEGLVAGAGVGVLAGLVAAACCEGEPGAYFPQEYVVGFAVGLFAVPIGSVIGFIRGHRFVYEPR